MHINITSLSLSYHITSHYQTRLKDCLREPSGDRVSQLSCYLSLSSIQAQTHWHGSWLQSTVTTTVWVHQILQLHPLHQSSCTALTPYLHAYQSLGLGFEGGSKGQLRSISLTSPALTQPFRVPEATTPVRFDLTFNLTFSSTLQASSLNHL